ncbi:tRNA 4-thiouridine(8) synthase ThiI, partial [Treponema pallidum]
SIRPYEDCCTLFAPKHPVLRPEVEEMQKQYQSLMLGPLLEDAFRTRKRTRIYGNYGVQESGE